MSSVQCVSYTDLCHCGHQVQDALYAHFVLCSTVSLLYWTFEVLITCDLQTVLQHLMKNVIQTSVSSCISQISHFDTL